MPSASSLVAGADATARSETALVDAVPVGGFDVGKLFDVRDWVCVVTGGGTGLGLVTARALAENGARVYITGRREAVLAAAKKSIDAAAQAAGKGGEVRTVTGDMATKEGVVQIRDAIAAQETHVNLLVNNHGVSLGRPAFTSATTPEEMSAEMVNNETFERWTDTYTINTTSYYFTTFAFLPLLCKAKEAAVSGGEAGNVIIVSSMSGITNTSQRGQFAYNASKAATLALSDMLATEFARRDLGVRVNCVCPGYFASGMSVIDPTKQVDSRVYREQWAIPAARPGNAIDYAQTIISTAKNQYMTGGHVVVDGGWLLDTAELSF